jgi:stearoyl-CoA desaturase (delta-9 desaturase)
MDGRAHQRFVFLTAVLPPIGIIVLFVLGWHHYSNWTDLGILVVSYTLPALGVSAGFHRLLAHRAYTTPKPIRLTLAVLGTMAAEGPPIIWVSHHRRHHQFSDQDGDPHSPHVGRGTGWRGVLGSFWHAHMGWLFDEQLSSDPMKYAPDLVRERQMRWISRYFFSIVAVGMLLPALAGFLLSGTVAGALTGFLWGALVRTFLLHHATYAVNSVGHMTGRRRYEVRDRSRNVFWLALPSFGEAWHNNHHAFPRSARHGLRWWEVDLSGLFIHGLRRVGLAEDVVIITPERQRMRAQGQSRVPRPFDPDLTDDARLAGTAGEPPAGGGRA